MILLYNQMHDKVMIAAQDGTGGPDVTDIEISQFACSQLTACWAWRHRHGGHGSRMGEIEVTFRGATSVARAGETVNIPANAPHQFRNKAAQPARLLCICAPAGQDAFFLAVGVPVASRTAPPPELDAAAQAAFRAKAEALASHYRTELLQHA